MVAKKPVSIDYRPNVRIKIQSLFTETLYNEVLPFTLAHWGATVMIEFLKEVNKRILMLYSMPDANPKNRFIESTATKTYRSIILTKYPYIIIYSVQKNVVTVLNIVHKSRNPNVHNASTLQTN